MHCFTGSTSFSKNLLKLNAYFSASGIITFKNSLELQETFKQIPLDNLLIETDSPFLSPVPMRGKKNEPSFIKYTLEKLALLKNIDKRFSKETGLPVHIADDPLACVAVGTGIALEQEETFNTMLSEY